MRTKVTWLAMACAAALAAGSAGAQDNQGEQTFTGCVEAGKAAGSYVLTHVMAGDAAAAGSEAKDAKAPASLDLASASVKIAPHNGHKVTVSGKTMQHEKMTMLMVDSLKMVSKTCP
ncbi:MAG TPA: hypothetical protein VFV10_10955 [Gammaproteobacteria bacterium]|nr:hypothetical protein [Gammaproteobacteria bacterium]